MQPLLSILRRDEKGTTMVEYAIMLALVAIAVALGAPNIKDAVVNVFKQAVTALGG